MGNGDVTEITGQLLKVAIVLKGEKSLERSHFGKVVKNMCQCTYTFQDPFKHNNLFLKWDRLQVVTKK